MLSQNSLTAYHLYSVSIDSSINGLCDKVNMEMNGNCVDVNHGVFPVIMNHVSIHATTSKKIPICNKQTAIPDSAYSADLSYSTMIQSAYIAYLDP